MKLTHQSEVSKLKSTINELKRLVPGRTEGSSSLTSRITAVEARIRQVEEKNRTHHQARIDEIQQTISEKTQEMNNRVGSSLSTSRIAAVEAKIGDMNTLATTFKPQITSVKVRVRKLEAILMGVVVAVIILFLVPPFNSQICNGMTLTSFESRISSIERKTRPIAVEESSRSLIISGVNVHIRNGMSKTYWKNGVGNLIVGYNERMGTEDRNGSHNIVIGPDHSFSSHSGIVTGWGNTISGPQAVCITCLPRVQLISPKPIQSSSGCHCWVEQQGCRCWICNNCRVEQQRC